MSGHQSRGLLTGSAIAEAESLDAAGRHNEAVDTLFRATARGDLQAKTRLAKRLLIGDRAPLRPQDGLRFAAEAAEAGGAEAAAAMAVLLAAGVHVQQDWPAAIDALAVAAERGWEPARQQLCVLSGECSDGAAVGTGERSDGAGNGTSKAQGADGEAKKSVAPRAGADWKRIARSIDIESWQRVPDAVTLHGKPRVVSFPHFVPDGVCEHLVAVSRPRLQRARVYHPLRRKDMIDDARTNTQANFGLLDTDLVTICMQTRIAAACGVPFKNLEAASVLHYSVGEQSIEHYDFVDPRVPNYEEEIRARGQRIITFLVYMNDDYSGGETAFPRLDVYHKGRRTEGLLFVNALDSGEPDLRMVHAGRPPTNGEKWVVSQFVRNRQLLA